MATRGRRSAAERAAAALGAKGQYDAGGMGRRMRGWNPPTSGPNRAIQGLQKIRDRSRDSVRNDWASQSSVQRWVTNLIGIGIIPRFKRIKSKTRRQELTDLWNDWVKVSDSDGVLTFYGQQTLATRAWLESGEVFVRQRPRDVADGLPVPLQLQLVEAEFVPLIDFDQDPRLPVGNRVRQGIELDRRGRRVACWMHREHPGDPTTNTTFDRSSLLRIPADQVAHIYEPARPGALRGVSILAPVLARLRNIADYDDAVIERQKLANLFMAFIKKVMPTAYDDEVNPLTGLPSVWEDGKDEPLAPMAAGTVHELLPGEEVQFANPPEAGTTFSDYMRTSQLGTAAGSHLPYELMAGDIKDVSDRTLRIIITEFRRLAEQRQWQIIIPKFQTVLEWWAESAVLFGKIATAEIDDVKRVEWAPHGWAYIHPVQDAQGKQIEVDAGFRSRASVIAERGDDPEQVDEERAADKKRADSLGLTPPPPPAPTKGGKPGDQQPPQKALQRDEIVSAVRDAVQGREPPAPANVKVEVHNAAPAAPQVNVHNEVQPTPVNVNNQVQPTPVNVTNEVNPTPVNVHNQVDVAAPNVEVRNEVPAVQQVEITGMPTRKIEASVTRDADGNIKKTTQTETDAE